MAVTHTTFLNRYNVSDQFEVPKIINSYNTILESNDWGTNSLVQNGVNAPDAYGRYYFTENSYIELGSYMYGGHWAAYIKLVTPNEVREIKFTDSNFYTISVGKTSKGICISYLTSKTNVSRDPLFYNLYVGEITKLDGSITKGCIYAADDGTLTIATDDGISSEKAQTSTINANRTAILTPVVDTTYGNVFKDIYFMRSSLLNCNIMAVEGQGNFLCGKTLALKD